MFHFLNLHEILNSLEKKMIVLANIFWKANVFWKLQTVKNILTPLC